MIRNADENQEDNKAMFINTGFIAKYTGNDRVYIDSVFQEKNFQDLITSIEWSASAGGRTIILGVEVTTDRMSRRNPPKKGTTLHSRMSNAALTASLYSNEVSRENMAADSVWSVERSSSDKSSQKGLSFSDLEEVRLDSLIILLK